MNLECLDCGMQSDEVTEYMNHCRDKHHRLVRLIDDPTEAYEVWLEGNAA